MFPTAFFPDLYLISCRQSAYEDGREVLEGFWGRVLSLRGSNALARYFLLNDPMAHQEWEMVKKTNL